MISLAQKRRRFATQARERFSSQAFTVRNYGHVPAPVFPRFSVQGREVRRWGMAIIRTRGEEQHITFVSWRCRWY
jgi:hypothetical protein